MSAVRSTFAQEYAGLHDPAEGFPDRLCSSLKTVPPAWDPAAAARATGPFSRQPVRATFRARQHPQRTFRQAEAYAHLRTESKRDLLIPQRTRPWEDQLSDDHSRSQTTSSRRGAASKNHRFDAGKRSSLSFAREAVIISEFSIISSLGARCCCLRWSFLMPSLPEFLLRLHTSHWSPPSTLILALLGVPPSAQASAGGKPLKRQETSGQAGLRGDLNGSHSGRHSSAPSLPFPLRFGW